MPAGQELSHEEYANLMSVLEAELLMEEDMLAREHQAAAIAAFEVLTVPHPASGVP